MLHTETAAEIIEIAQRHLQILVARKWPDMQPILEDEGELTINVKVAVTNRSPEPGEHADKDNRIKSTISFSKRFTESTESALEDPNQPELELEQTPESRARFSLSEQMEAAIREYPDKDLLRHRFENVRQFDPVTYATDDSFDRFYEAVSELIAARSAPEGGDVEQGQGQTSVGSALDAAAVRAQVADIDLDLSVHGEPFALVKAFRKAAKKAKWSPAQVGIVTATLELCYTLDAMKDTLRPFIRPAVVEPTTVLVGGSDQPVLPIALEPGFAADRTLMVFLQAAKENAWTAAALDVVTANAQNIKDEAGDAHESANAATFDYLSQFCRKA